MNIQTLSEPLYRAKGWMKLVGVMMIISGVLQALSIIGIIIAWLPIWIGVLLFQSAGLVERAYTSGDDNTFVMALAKLRTYFTIMGVLMLIAICIGVVVVILSITGALLLPGLTGQQQPVL